MAASFGGGRGSCRRRLALGRGELSLETLFRHRADIDTFVTSHGVLAMLAYVWLYIVRVALAARASWPEASAR